MKKEKIILDFIVFILLDFEELISDETHFFDRIGSDDVPFKDMCFDNNEYEKYILNRINVSNIISYKDKEFTEINNINEILNSEEISDIITYLFDNFRYGYPTDFEDGFSLGGNIKLKISNSEIREYFHKYLSYKTIKNNIYLTYYYSFLKDIMYISEKHFELEKKIIDNLNISKELLDGRDKIDFIESKRVYYKERLFNSVENLNFQIKGFSDDKGLFIDFEMTLFELLKFTPFKSPNNINETVEAINYIPNLANLINQYFKLKVLNSNIAELKYDTNNQKNLFSDLNQLKEENSDLIEFLISKKFLDSEIDIILNTLSNGKYNDLNIRNLNFTIQINYFHFCYAFYIFDFFSEKRNIKFTSENSFKEILKFSHSYFNFDKNAYLKYYKNINSDKSDSDYPFKRFDKFLTEIEEKLRINTNNLKKTNI